MTRQVRVRGHLRKIKGNGYVRVRPHLMKSPKTK